IAVLFDMDGVLVDSEPIINAAAIRALAEFGIKARPEDFQPFVGAGENRYLGGVAELHGKTFVPEMKRRTYDWKSTRLNSSHITISYDVFCLKKKKNLAHNYRSKTQQKKIKLKKNKHEYS